MPSEHPEIRFLLDEHYPGRLAEALTADGVDTVALTAHRPELHGRDHRVVLEAAVAERRIVVTEDVATFTAAIALVPHHVGAVFCHHARYPRAASGLRSLQRALAALAEQPPTGLGHHPLEWWLPPPAG